MRRLCGSWEPNEEPSAGDMGPREPAPPFESGSSSGIQLRPARSADAKDLVRIEVITNRNQCFRCPVPAVTGRPTAAARSPVRPPPVTATGGLLRRFVCGREIAPGDRRVRVVRAKDALVVGETALMQGMASAIRPAT